MSLIDRIQAEIARHTKNGDKPNIVWLGKEERREFEDVMASLPLTIFKKDSRGNYEVCGLPVEFVSSSNWLSISVCQH